LRRTRSASGYAMNVDAWSVRGTSDEPLSAAERAELLRLRREVSELQKDTIFKKAATYFASNHQAERFALMDAEYANLRSLEWPAVRRVEAGYYCWRAAQRREVSTTE